MAVTLADLVLRAKQRCDRVNSSFISDGEWNTYVNEGMLELWDLLTMTWEDYGLVSYSINLEPGVENYDLPDYNASPGTPAVAATDVLEIQSDPPYAGSSVVIEGTTFLAVAVSPTGTQFDIGGSAEYYIANLVYAINHSVAGLYVTASVNPDNSSQCVLTAVAAGIAGNYIHVTANSIEGSNLVEIGARGALHGGVDAVPSGETQYKVYKLRGVDLNSSGNTYTLQQFQFRQRNKFKQAWPFNSALYARIMYYQLLGNKIRVIPAPTLADTVTLWYVPQLPLMTASVDLDSYIPESYVDFIIASAAAKAKVKEDDDPSGMYADKAMIAKRIQDVAKTRVAGEPRCIVDVRNDTDLDEFYQHRMRY
jgi:hypothetical protein